MGANKTHNFTRHYLRWHLEEEHFEKGKGLFEKGHLEKRQLRKGIVEGQFRKGIMEGQSGGALWKGRKGTVHKLEFLQIS